MRRESQPLADLLVEVVSPVLITLLVSSLVCFVVEVLYQGQYNFRLQAILCLFVMGAVSTARISMTDGASYASLFAAPLGLVTLIALLRFVEFEGPLAAAGPVISAAIMVGIWWCAHQLTVDSTLVERDRDQTGTGLLSQLGWDADLRETPAVDAANATPLVDGVTDAQAVVEEETWWDRLVLGTNRPHTPGTWAFYFSLAALPIFGLGQWFLPADDLAGRRWVLQLALVYVACALGLLLSTSFLGLRHYLRQRKLELPLEMAASWLILGGGMIAAIMLVAFLLPRPMPEYSLAQWLPPITSPTRSTSPLAVGKEGVRESEKQGEGTTRQPQPRKNDAGKQSSANNNGSGDKQSDAGNAAKGESTKSGGDSSNDSGKSESDAGSQSGDKGSSGGKSSGKQGNDNQDKQKNAQPQTGGREDSQAGAKNEVSKSPAQQQPANSGHSGKSPKQSPSQPAAAPASPPASTPLFANLPDLLNRLGMLIALAVAGYFAWRYRDQLRDAWDKFKQEWQALLAKLFGGRERRESTPTAVAIPPPPPQPFASFADPFATGQAAGWTVAELLRYSFAALEAWGREHACERKGEQTPLEYAAAVANQQPTVAAEVQQFALFYGQVAYGPGSGSPSLDVVRQFWQRLRG